MCWETEKRVTFMTVVKAEIKQVCLFFFFFFWGGVLRLAVSVCSSYTVYGWSSDTYPIVWSKYHFHQSDENVTNIYIIQRYCNWINQWTTNPDVEENTIYVLNLQYRSSITLPTYKYIPHRMKCFGYAFSYETFQTLYFCLIYRNYSLEIYLQII
jgi:hypothetical protein